MQQQLASNASLFTILFQFQTMGFLPLSMDAGLGEEQSL
jgi:hypothetical protein